MPTVRLVARVVSGVRAVAVMAAVVMAAVAETAGVVMAVAVRVAASLHGSENVVFNKPRAVVRGLFCFERSVSAFRAGPVS